MEDTNLISIVSVIIAIIALLILGIFIITHKTTDLNPIESEINNLETQTNIKIDSLISDIGKVRIDSINNRNLNYDYDNDIEDIYDDINKLDDDIDDHRYLIRDCLEDNPTNHTKFQKCVLD